MKEINRLRRIWTQTIIPPMVTMTLYFIIFGKLIGKRVGLIHGIPYMQFIVPGLVMMSIIQNAYTNTSSSLFGEKFGRSIEEVLIAPVKNYIIIIGYTVGGVYRGILSGIIVTLVSLYFTHLPIHHIFIMLTTAFLTSILFSLAGIINGIFAKKFDDVSLIPTFVLTPLTYLGGVFYPIQLLKPPWKEIALLNPIAHIVQAFRYGMLGVGSTTIYFPLGTIFICTCLLFATCIYLLRSGTGMRS